MNNLKCCDAGSKSMRHRILLIASKGIESGAEFDFQHVNKCKETIKNEHHLKIHLHFTGDL